MSKTVVSWTGTIQDGYPAAAIGFVNALGLTVGKGTFTRAYVDTTGGTEAAGVTFQIFGASTKVDDLVEDTLAAGEVGAGARYVSDLANHTRPAYFFIAKCDTGAATHIGTWRFILDHGGDSQAVYEFTIDPATSPSDAP